MKKRFIGLMALVLTACAASLAAGQEALIFTPSRVEKAQQRMKTNPEAAEGWKTILQIADEALQNGNIGKCEYLSLAYAMTSDVKYADKMRDILLKFADSNVTSSVEMLGRKPSWRSDLGLASKSFQAALAYSAVRDRLTASERKKISENLYKKCVEPALGDWLVEPTRIHSLNSMGHNWWTACCCEGAMLAMAIEKDQPQCSAMVAEMIESLPLWFSFAGDELQNKMKTFDDAGGMYESIGYANFGISEALKFLIAWKDRHQNEKAPEIPQLENLSDFFIASCYPRTGALYTANFGDGHVTTCGDQPLCLLWALGYQNADILWYLSQMQSGQHKENFDLQNPMGFVFRPDMDKAPLEPSMSKNHILSDFGWALMRDSWKADATLLAVKSGHTWNHNHADANSFQIFHKGSQLIKDCGNCYYPNEAYRRYFFQSESHNSVLFNGEGQLTYQQYHGSMLDGSVHELLSADDMHYVFADGTGPYSDKFSRFFRHFLWTGKVILVIDDIHSHEIGQFEWLWHYSGKATRRGCQIEVTDGEASAMIYPLYPRLMAASNFVHDYPDDLYWDIRKAPTEDLKGEEEYYSLILPGKTDYVKAVNAIILKDSPSDKDLPQIERRHGENWIGLRITYQGKVTDLYINQLADGRLMHLNSWIECDGWQTDAYMFSVTYNEGESCESAKDLFISYGSALRRGENTWFSSLSKLFLMAHDKGTEMDISISGQPHYIARLQHSGKLKKLTVNGLSVQPTMESGMLKLAK